MMNEARIIAAIKRKLDDYAHAALQHPAGRDAFEYGRVTGIYAGLKMALIAVEEALGDEDEEKKEHVKRRNAYSG